MAVATIAEIADAVSLTIPSGSGSSGTQAYLGVFQRHGLYALAPVDHGWYQNTSGSTQTLRIRNGFAFGGYGMGVWAIVSSTAPGSNNPTPAADATAAGATNLTIPGGNGSSSQTLSVPNNSYVYIVQIDVNIAWAGGSDETMVLQTTGGTDLATIAYFPSPGSGSTNESWKSPAYITGGTQTPPTASKWAGVRAGMSVPNNCYLYVVRLSYHIPWAGASNETMYLYDTGGNLQTQIQLLPTQNPSTFDETWDSPFWLTGGSSSPPNATRWPTGGSNRGVTRSLPGVSGIDHGWWQNVSGSLVHVHLQVDFGFGGYGPWTIVAVARQEDPSTVVAPSGLSLPTQGVWIG